MVLALVVLALLCLMAATILFPLAATLLWVQVLAAAPFLWIDKLLGQDVHETVIGLVKGDGLLLLAALAYRLGTKRDRYNPSFAFIFMFLTGLMHGLYPGLTILSSLRSLIGSASPFTFSFIRLPPSFIRAVVWAVLWAPLGAVFISLLVYALGGDTHCFVIEEGALRWGNEGEAPFLAGFALTGIYAGLLEWLTLPRPSVAAALLINLAIILLTGARSPLFIALFNMAAVMLIEGRILTLAFGCAVAAATLLFAPSLGFVRVIGLFDLGLGTNLSHRDLVWPYFQQALFASPWFGWGSGAGKFIIPTTSLLNHLLGTNAAHNEYLRIGVEGGFIGLAALIGLMVLWVRRNTAPMPLRERWMLRVIFIGFAIQSITDNTLIATTSSVFFLWVSCIFASAQNRTTPSP